MFADGVSLPGLSEKVMYQTCFNNLRYPDKKAAKAFQFPAKRMAGYKSQDAKAKRKFNMTLEHVGTLLQKQNGIQEDPEKALIFALVHDPEFRLASALATTPSGADVNVIRALLFVFEDYEDQLRKLPGLLMFREMVEVVRAPNEISSPRFDGKLQSCWEEVITKYQG
ncbi:chromodomain protein, putative [Plasmopara halstedii]|uniref:Chromodomain protein, putative n=1 Tax=Plasmopara halstedii TaxID=4781 RepID=A0A0N7L3F4_PLAHL|nr:chromodomain protein, putative [Plasmopara halstedii]CEG35723.1 chromodomain protein, putative [Plasmopara halstedii]|eukprot:XP_024572092.1 chromodomain protein, putative [Plasmopara halstedii]